MPHDKTDGLASKTFANNSGSKMPTAIDRTAVAGIEIVQPDLPDQPVVDLDDPTIGISDQFLKPPRRSVSGQRLHVISITPNSSMISAWFPRDRRASTSSEDAGRSLTFLPFKFTMLATDIRFRNASRFRQFR